MTLKEARLAAGLTQRGMSELLDLPMRTIGSWEDGSRKCPPWAERLVIAELLRIAEAKSQTEKPED